MKGSSTSEPKISFKDKLIYCFQTPFIWFPSFVIGYLIFLVYKLVIEWETIDRGDIIREITPLQWSALIIIIPVTFSIIIIITLIFGKQLEARILTPQGFPPIFIDLGFIIALIVPWTIFSIHSLVFGHLIFLLLSEGRETIFSHPTLLPIPLGIATVSAIIIILWNYSNRTTATSDVSTLMNQLENVPRRKKIVTRIFIGNEVLKGVVVLLISLATLFPTSYISNRDFNSNYILVFIGFNLCIFVGTMYFSLFEMLYKYSWKHIRTYIESFQ